MSNRNFNKQTTNARQGFASGSGSTVKKLTSKLPKPTGRSNPPKDYKKSTSKELKAMLDGVKNIDSKFQEKLAKKKYAPEFKNDAVLIPTKKNNKGK